MSSYPRKYWWLVLIVVPLVVGLISIFPKIRPTNQNSAGHNIVIEHSNIDGSVEIIDTQVIINQLRDTSISSDDMKKLEGLITKAHNLAAGGLYSDAISLFEEAASKSPSPIIYNNLGNLYRLEGRQGLAEKTFKKGISIGPRYQPLHFNLGRLYKKQGKTQEAIRQLKQAPDEPHALDILLTLRKKADSEFSEQEPNNDIRKPNDAPLSKNILGSVSETHDIDFYKFTSPEPLRDILEVSLKNLSTNLKPRVRLWGFDKQHYWQNSKHGFQVTEGQDVYHSFSVWPNQIYYISVAGLGGEGKYQLTIHPKKSYDKYEPNDDILSAKDVELGSSIKANLMDKIDQDYCFLRGSGNDVSIFLKNSSPDLQPRLQIWRRDKVHLWENSKHGFQVTPGQDVVKSFTTTVGENYYVSVSSLGGHGEYTLSLSE